ncbi:MULTISPECIES: ABC transporter ATP-binding protein [Sulfurospirillum]|uniref:Phospholipid ABC transporter, ATP-binding protein MlaF n=3 Tax=Sulfurospirillum TaxID=57665 RepID=A0A1D7TGE0_9BACT|nr:MULTISPECIES: ATP-binding cassette domain-containing protein [Sulfurospirillum]AHJ11440.1 phospholipid ABC transporter, ATP-binding protein MlaF [Sulfurospirillum multivorans DSM 12446]AOO63944.1 phospholipid ABC transporter, ATP-binding protein MlaF [Sulfurospirillum halorespirans DSM 13726]QEH04944.1 phospholipid ABC transporter, ATP-binding protein MlaF [Sulfurospirillum multivorans]
MKNHVVIEAKEIVTSFGKNVIHDGISFKIQKGEIFGLLGGSGSGKTTLLREMIMLQRTTEGQMLVLGTDVMKASSKMAQKLRQKWGVLFQFGALFTSLTILENITIAMREYTDLPAWIIEESALMKLSMVGLPPKVATMFPSELSGGMKKRAGLARALALDPKLLFLDEPTSGLDPQSARAFDELILTLRDTLGITVVMVTHDKDTMANVLDRFVILGNKKVLFEGNMEQLKQTTNDELKKFLS